MIYNTIVIGGGIAGIESALALSKAGQKVLLIEAQGELGGRVKSVGFNGSDLQYDTGAHWFHGGKKNPFYRQVNKDYALGFVWEDTGEDRLYSYQGKNRTDDFKKHLENLNGLYNKMAAKRKDDFTLADVDKSLKSPEAKALVYFKAPLWMAADSAGDVSVKDMLGDPLGPGGMQLEKGIAHLIKQMAAALQKSGVKILMNTPVQSVKNTSDGVVVATDDGRKFTAGNAIVTASVGVLKEKTIAFDAMTEATLDQKLANYEMGDFFKAGLRIKEGYFKKNPVPANQAVWVVDEKFPKFIHACTADKPTITVFAGGAHARELETKSLPQVKKFALAAMAETPFFEGIQKYVDDNVIATKWRSNQFIRGAYSHKIPDGVKSDPFMCRNIIFAGEAWVADVQNSPGQMAGAWYSAHKGVAFIL